MAATKYLIERAVLNGTKIGGLTNLRLDEGVEKMLDSGSSELDPAFISVHKIKPIFTFDTYDIKTFLDLAFVGGNVIPHVVLASNFDAYFQATADGGTRGGAGTNQLLRAAVGVCVPIRISGFPMAKLTVAVYAASSNGTSSPLTRSSAQSLPGGTASPAATWRIAGIKNNTDIIKEIESWGIDFNVGVTGDDRANTVYPMLYAVDNFAPTGSFETRDCAAALTLSGLTGSVAHANGLIFHLAQYDNTNFVGINTTGALGLKFANPSPWYPSTINVGQTADTKVAYVVKGHGGDTIASPPLTYVTGQTLPAETAGTRFMGGPIKDNTTEVEYISGTINFAQSWSAVKVAALPWSNWCAMTERLAQARYRIADQDYYLALANGRAIATAYNFYLRAMDTNSEPTPDATAAHVKIVMSAGYIEPAGTGASHQDYVFPEIVITQKGSGMTLATAAIT